MVSECDGGSVSEVGGIAIAGGIRWGIMVELVMGYCMMIAIHEYDPGHTVQD